MLRRKRITAQGGCASRTRRSAGEIAGPVRPTPKTREYVRFDILSRPLQAVLQGGEERQGGDRGQVVQVDGAQLLQDELLGRGEEEHLPLSRALPLVAGE